MSEITRLLNQFCTSWGNKCFGHSQRHWLAKLNTGSIQSSYLLLWAGVVWGESVEQKKAGCAWGTMKLFYWDVLVRRWKWVHCYTQHEGMPQRALCLKICGTQVSPGGKASTHSSAVDAINTDCKLRNLSEEPHQKGKQMLPAIPIQMTVPGWATVY